MIAGPIVYRLILLAGIALALIGAGWWVRDTAADRELAVLEAVHAYRQAAWEQAARESEMAERMKEQARHAAINKEIEDVRQDAARDAGRAAGLAASADKLRAHIARLATAADQGCGHPPAAAGSASAAGAGLVLADLYRGADDEAQELARTFDAARRAGLACERIHDALTTTTIVHSQPPTESTAP